MGWTFSSLPSAVTELERADQARCRAGSMSLRSRRPRLTPQARPKVKKAVPLVSRTACVSGSSSTDAPEAVGLLRGEDGAGHVAEELNVARVVGVIAGEEVDDAGEAGVNPAVAAGPVDGLAVALAEVAVGFVAEVEADVGQVEAIGGEPPFAVHEVEVAVVAGFLPELKPGDGGHEEGVAPGPEVGAAGRAPVEDGGRGIREDVVEALLRGGDHAFVAINLIQVVVGLDDGVVVGVVDAFVRLPLENLVGVAAEAFAFVFLGGNAIEGENADIEGGDFPAARMAAGGFGREVGPLPVGEAVAERDHGGAFERRGGGNERNVGGAGSTLGGRGAHAIGHGRPDEARDGGGCERGGDLIIAVALNDVLDEQMGLGEAAPEDGVDGGLPGAEGVGVEFADGPVIVFGDAEAGAAGEQGAAAVGVVAVDEVEGGLVPGGVDEEGGAGDRRVFRAGAGEGEGARGGGAGDDVPSGVVVVEDLEPGRGAGLRRPVAADVGAAVLVAVEGGRVDEVAVGGDAERVFGVGGGEGEGERGAVGFGPGDTAVGGAGVAKVVVGGDVGGVAPDPSEVEGAAAVDGEVPVGRGAAFAVDEVGLDGGPGPRGGVVAVEEEGAVAGAAVAVEEEEVAVGKEVELGIRDAGLALAGHGGGRGEVEREGRGGAGVAERDVVVTPGDVEEAVAVDGEGDGVVGVGGVGAVIGAAGLPGVVAELALGEDEVAVGVVEGGELGPRVGDDRRAGVGGDVDGGAGEGLLGDRDHARRGGLKGEGGEREEECGEAGETRGESHAREDGPRMEHDNRKMAYFGDGMGAEEVGDAKMRMSMDKVGNREGRGGTRRRGCGGWKRGLFSRW